MKELICSQCGAPLSYKGQVLKCEYCGTLYNEPEETVDIFLTDKPHKCA